MVIELTKHPPSVSEQEAPVLFPERPVPPFDVHRAASINSTRDPYEFRFSRASAHASCCGSIAATRHLGNAESTSAEKSPMNAPASTTNPGGVFGRRGLYSLLITVPAKLRISPKRGLTPNG